MLPRSVTLGQRVGDEAKTVREPAIDRPNELRVRRYANAGGHRGNGATNTHAQLRVEEEVFNNVN